MHRLPLELYSTYSQNSNVKIASKVLLESGQMRLSQEDPQNVDPARVP